MVAKCEGQRTSVAAEKEVLISAGGAGKTETHAKDLIIKKGSCVQRKLNS